VPVARGAVGYTSSHFTGVAGLWAEAGTAPAIHPDLRLRFRNPNSHWSPDLTLLGAVGMTTFPVATANGDIGTLAGVSGTTRTVLERGRIEAGFRPAGGVRAIAWAEHHQALDIDSPMAADIFASFAPTGGDEVGIGAGWIDVRRQKLWFAASAQQYAPNSELDPRVEGMEHGGRVELTWRPRCATEAWCVTPNFRAASGPGGVYASVGSDLAVPVPDPFALHVYGMLVPYRKVHADWDSAVVAGATADLRPAGKFWAVEIGGDVTHDGVAPFDPRLWLSLRAEAK
jgi:hypothetical protein